ncbi:MAG: hypothetical protein KBD82_05620 [Rhodoferax sp.]|jgi:hypothetical protein|uniref:hypothetical protein n=1 Tax=Rhodoferax sp. TaxID=50421 RepID=UPI001B5D1931|nr:hypothetical protein [Rhodoferax sp.]MBK7051932.1 hypothetical protein [Rhodoferax sp.]MBP9735101.1 hypothetical protein [Rhodoferax sp.]
MKITIKPPKPRNPLFLAARTRHAGAHKDEKSARQVRRKEKQVLRNLVSGRTTRGAQDE